ncbi:MAG: serine hydrolase [Raineya sp.]|nr:serine hydrolase [Raineya sp.]
MKKPVYFLFLIFIQVAFAKNLDTNFLKKRIPQMMDSAGVPGLSLGVVKKGKIVWTKNFGKANLATQKPVNPHTIFEAASLSKPLFAYICLRLVDEGKLDLDKPLVEYVSVDSIERFFLMHKVQDKRFLKITARMCLSHSAGFPNVRTGIVPIVFEPTTDMHYSGIGISYLQFVVERITNKNLEVLAQEYVFKPLGMNNSSFIWQNSFTDRVANGHGSLGQTVGFGVYTTPSASYTLLTNAEDYSKFLAHLLNQEGLKPETYQEMWKVQSTAKTNFLASMSWGLGFGLYETDLGRAFWHWGDLGTAKAYVVGIPAEKDGLVLFANSANGLNMAYSLINMCIGGGTHQFFHVLNVVQYDDPTNILMQQFSKNGLEGVLVSYNYFKVHQKYKLNQALLVVVAQRLLALGRANESLAVAKIGVLEFPENSAAHNVLADAYLRLGKIRNAIGCYRRAYQLNPQNTYAREQLIKLKAL